MPLPALHLVGGADVDTFGFEGPQDRGQAGSLGVVGDDNALPDSGSSGVAACVTGWYKRIQKAVSRKVGEVVMPGAAETRWTGRTILGGTRRWQ